MARRVSLPAADDLFRPTTEVSEGSTTEHPSEFEPVETSETPATSAKPSGRVRHDEKMTVYVTSEELLEIEHARLSLRRRHRLAVDRGRLVREAVALVLADLEANGEDSALVLRLREG